MKKIISFIIMFSMFLGMVLPYNVKADEKTKVTYQQAIENAKKAFNLDTKNYEISHSYNEDENGKGFYELNWLKKEGNGSINVSVDAVTGEILRMNSYEPSENSQKKIPKFSKAEALKAAEDFIKKLQPQKFTQMKLIVNEYNPNPSYMGYSYNFNFVRILNGIEFSENGIGIGIEIDKNTLKILSYNYSWDNCQLPDLSKKMSLERAKDIFKEKLGIELSYRLITKPGSKEQTPILVYTLKNGNNPIDALTGEVLYQHNIIYRNNMSKKEAMDENGGLTPEELKSIEENSKLISKNAAIAVVEKSIPQLKDFKLETSNLYSIGNGDSAKWRFSWNYTDNEKNSDIYASINAEVDAVNSKLISFYISGNKFYPDTKTEPSYSKEQSKNIADKFLKELEGDKLSQCEYRDLDRNTGTEKPSSYDFYYIRKYDGAVCPFNTISVSVNAYTGQIMTYSLNWKEYALPSTNEAMKLQAAYKTLFEKVDFSLKYIRMRTDRKYGFDNYDIKLAYLLDDNFTMLDAMDGTLLDYNGKPLKKISSLSFDDIKGTKYEKDIMLLMELGIIDASGGKFNPNAEILQKDFIKLVMKSLDPYIDFRSNNLDYELYYKEALDRKLISQNEKKPDSMVTRLEASKILVRALGFGGIAELSDIYSLKAKDLKSIPMNMTGYVALSSRLGIVKLNNGNFYPTSTVKRGEAASIIINYLKVEL